MLQKFRKNQIKKSARRNLPESPGWGQRATTKDPGALVARRRDGRTRGAPRSARGAPGSLVPPWLPPFAYILPPRRKPLISNSFSRSPLYTAAVSVSRSGLPGDAALAPYWKEELPPGVPPSPWTPPGCAMSSPLCNMGP